MKSAKKEKKIESEMKMKREELEWKVMQRNQKINSVIQRKKMIEMEDEAKKQKKLDEYFEKTFAIQQKIRS